MAKNLVTQKDCFIGFKEPVSAFPLPKKFTFPFYYEPHPLCVIAARELQQYLETQTEWEHNFGLVPGQPGLVIGKMFGVMVVQNPENELGYLAAFSGKLAGGNHHSRFVPPVFDMLTDGSFFLAGEEELNQINRDIERLENDARFLAAKQHLQEETIRLSAEQERYRQQIRLGKRSRKSRREKAAGEPDKNVVESLLEELRRESLKEQYFFKDFSKNMKLRLQECRQNADAFREKIDLLKESRKTKSADLQQRLFKEYHFLNRYGEKKSLLDIFQTDLHITPPAGAGECAAPKLLQYAFLNGLKPIAMAEFWWGAPPKSEVRNHGQFYPACRGKCEPILAHMLKGMDVDPNPMAAGPQAHIIIPVVYEDEHMAVINKPAEFLSVPGINVRDSVYTRMKQKYPDATGPLIVHRLDMSTSGLMLIAKTNEAYLNLQSQFIRRSIRKRYVALLDGNVHGDEGEIDLPLRVDLDDRPRQLVCHDYGKPAQTKWKVIQRKQNRTRVHFFPITGRTHQLRVHASHSLGLNTPIVGDDLYGNKANRLHLHAEWIEFRHPAHNQTMSLFAEPDF